MKEVDAAMDQMARELEMNESALPQEEITKETVEQTYTDLGAPEIGNLSLESREEPPKEESEEAKAKSAVSEAAERLLESVQHEDGEKWKNSVFLSLMRDFRDGRKDIVGAEIRDNEETPETGSKSAD